MSFEKARELIHLAMMAATKEDGVSLEEIVEEFGVAHRTAQRMVRALADLFGPLDEYNGRDRKRRFRLNEPIMPALTPREDEALEALEVAIRDARAEGRASQAHSLARLREGYLNRLPFRTALRAETDAEAVLSSLERVTRPGPRVRIAPEVAEAVYKALKGPFQLRISYSRMNGDTAERIIGPLGLLLGPRSYLVAHLEDGALRHFRMDRIQKAECTDELFVPDPDFSLAKHASGAFSSFHDPDQYGPVVWKFSAKAAPIAAEFLFHPEQELEQQEDGSLIVRFQASGWNEMTWFLYQWGTDVEVLEPQELRELAHPYRRNFNALP